MILDVNGLKQQAIYIVNPMTVEVNPIALTTIPADVRSLYVKQKTNEDGSKVLSTNNFTYINEQYIDFKEVSAFVVNNIGSKILCDGQLTEYLLESMTEQTADPCNMLLHWY